MKKLVVVLLLFVVSFVSLQVQVEGDIEDLIYERTPMRKYYQPMDRFQVFCRYNRSDGETYVMIRLGPYLRLVRSQFLEEPIRITPRDPIANWTVEVLPINRSEVLTWYELVISSTARMEVTTERRFEIRIVNVSMLIDENSRLRTKVDYLTERVEDLEERLFILEKSGNATYKELIRYRELYNSLMEASMSFKTVKFVYKNITVPFEGQLISFIVPVPYYYDPYKGEWIPPQKGDIRMVGNELQYRFPWTKMWGEQGWFSTEEINLENPLFVFSMLLWYQERYIQTVEQLKNFKLWGMLIPIGVAGIVIIAHLIITFLRRRAIEEILRKRPEILYK